MDNTLSNGISSTINETPIIMSNALNITPCNSQNNANGLLEEIHNYRVHNVGKLIFATLNVNSIRNKLDEIKLLIIGNIDVLVLTETKLDESFPLVQFFIEGFATPYRLDRNKHGGGILIYVREDIPSKQLNKHTAKEGIEGIFLELNLIKYRLLVLGTYHPPTQANEYFLTCISDSLDIYLKDYNRFILLGDFNIKDNEQCLIDLNSQYDSKNIVKDPTCFKYIDNPSTIDLIITNTPRSFWSTKTINN